jgi:hypothetical protein
VGERWLAGDNSPAKREEKNYSRLVLHSQGKKSPIVTPFTKGRGGDTNSNNNPTTSPQGSIDSASSSRSRTRGLRLHRDRFFCQKGDIHRVASNCGTHSIPLDCRHTEPPRASPASTAASPLLSLSLALSLLVLASANRLVVLCIYYSCPFDIVQRP